VRHRCRKRSGNAGPAGPREVIPEEKSEESSSGCESRPAKAEPGRPVADLAARPVTGGLMRRNVSMRAEEETAPKHAKIPDAQDVGTSEGSSAATARGRGGRASGGVEALGASEAGRPSNPRDPEPSAGMAGGGATRAANSSAEGAVTGARRGGEEQASVSAVDGGKGNRSRRRRGQGVGEPHSSDEDGEPEGTGTRQSEGGSCLS
jgi:hypothetical protein